MSNKKIIPLKKPIIAEVTLPGSLTYTIRALIIASITKGIVQIKNALKSDDTYALFHALQILGISANETVDGFTIEGDIGDVKDNVYKLDIKLSGRSARMLLPLLCLIPGEKLLTCSEPFKKRPMGELVKVLREMGAEIKYLENEGSLPITISSSTLQTNHIAMNGEISSQYFTALLLIAPLINGITINVQGKQISKSFIDTTIAIMKDFGITVQNKNYQKYAVDKNEQYKNPTTYLVETDASSASYFWAIAAINQSIVRVRNLSTNSIQGDIGFVKVLEKMGCLIKENVKEQWIEVMGPKSLKGIDIDMNTMPDVVPTLAVVAAFAKGITHITNVEHLKLKESDRLEVPKSELQKMGIETTTTHNTITITGGVPHGATIATHHDHRIAMAFAIAGTKVSNVIIENVEVVTKSFPQFWQILNVIDIKTEGVK